MREKIIRLLEDKISDVYLEMQDELNIGDGFISPPDSFDQDEKTSELAEIIERVLRKQKGEIYMTSKGKSLTLGIEMETKVETNYTLKMTKENWNKLNIALSIMIDLKYLFNGDSKYMNIFGEAEDALVDIVNEVGKFKVEFID